MPFKPGRYVVMQGPGGRYSHFAGSRSENAVIARFPKAPSERCANGNEVTVGQPIGLSGQTGFASAPHLHLPVFQAIGRKLEARTTLT